MTLLFQALQSRGFSHTTSLYDSMMLTILRHVGVASSGQPSCMAWTSIRTNGMSSFLSWVNKFFVAVDINKNIQSIYQITVFQQSQVVQDCSCWLSSPCWNVCNGRWLEDILWKSVWKGKSQRSSPNSCWGSQDMKPWYVKVKVSTQLSLVRKPGRFQLSFF